METSSATLMYEGATGVLYDLPVATDEFLTVEQTRKILGKRLQLAQSETDPVNTVVTVHGHPEGVIVSVDWYVQVRAERGEPVSWQFAPKPPPRTKADDPADQ